LRRQGRAFELHILVSCAEKDFAGLPEGVSPEGLSFDFLDGVCRSGIGAKLKEKYEGKDMDALRWSLKPVYLAKLLARKGLAKAVYVDCDIHFFSDYEFIFAALDENRVLLAPHWMPYSKLSAEGRFGFDTHLVSGLFNAGFIGAAKGAEAPLNWWAEACLFKCEFDKWGGYFVDQTYLPAMHAFFEGVGVLRHKGCDVAFWNQEECPRRALPDGSATAGGERIVFAHFPVCFMDLQVAGEDKALLPYFLKYFEGLRKNGLSDYGAVFKKPANILRFKLEDVKRGASRRIALAVAPGAFGADCEKALAESELDCVARLDAGQRISFAQLRKAGAQALVALAGAETAKKLGKLARKAGLEAFEAALPRPLRNPLSALRPRSSLFSDALAELARKGLKNIVIYGAGDFTLNGLSASLPSQGTRLLGILDDDPAKRGNLLCGLPILGAEELEALRPDAILVSSDSIQEILYANAKRRFPGIEAFSLTELKSQDGCLFKRRGGKRRQAPKRA
jgi:hypothetical protein